MIKPLLSIIERLSTPRGLIAQIILLASTGLGIATTLSALTALTGGIGILDFSFGYSVDKVSTTFASYGEEGMILFRRIQFFDLFNPLFYSLLTASFIYLLYKSSRYKWVIIFPLLVGLLDYLENIFLHILSVNFPDVSTLLVSVSSTINVFKQLTLFVSIGLLLFGLAGWVRRRGTAST